MIMALLVMPMPLLAPSGTAGGASSRAPVDEIEPNNDYATAMPFPSNHGVVKANVTWDTDQVDIFSIAVTVGQVLNASFIMMNWNASLWWEYNIGIKLIGPLPDHVLIKDLNWTDRTLRNDTISCLAPETGTYFVEIWANGTDAGNHTKPTNYTLSAGTRDLATQGAGTYNGFMDIGNDTYNDVWYKMNIPTSEGIQASLTMGANLDIDLYIVVLWSGLPKYETGHKNPLWLNASTERGAGKIEFAKALAVDGTYYVRLLGWTGIGTYELRITQVLIEGQDNDNTLTTATTIDRKKTAEGRVDQAFDHFDWYKFHLAAGDCFNATMTLLTGTSNIVNFSLWDSTLHMLSGEFDTVNGTPFSDVTGMENYVDGSAMIQTWCAPAVGDYYALVMPIRELPYDANHFDAVVCDYRIVFELKNQGPRRTGTPDPIEFDEDTTYDGLNLYYYFEDPDGDNLTFAYAPKVSNLTITINQTAGKVTFKPADNWNTGADFIDLTFNATDPLANRGPQVNTTLIKVRVRPVNDNPGVIATLEMISIFEGGQTRQGDKALKDCFRDLDGETLNYTATSKAPQLLTRIDPITTNIIFGPVDLFAGITNVTITARDAANATAQFNVTVDIVHLNHLPTVKGGVTQLNVTMEEDTVDTSLKVDQLFEDIDLTYWPEEELKYITESLGGAQLFVDVDENNTLIIRPEANWTGQRDIRVTAKDMSDEKATVIVNVTVTPVNDIPVIETVSPGAVNMTIKEGEVQTFKVLSVKDPDAKVDELRYVWSVNALTPPAEDVDGGTYVLRTSFAPGTGNFTSGTYVVVVTVMDIAGAEAHFQWYLTITNVNQAPNGVNITSPVDGTEFKKGASISFKAMAFDIDQDPGTLNYTWTDKVSGEVLGSGRDLAYTDLSPGDHTIVLKVTDDGGLFVEKEVLVKVKDKKKGGTPFPGAGVTMMAMVAVAAIIALSRNRRDRED